MWKKNRIYRGEAVWEPRRPSEGWLADGSVPACGAGVGRRRPGRTIPRANGCTLVPVLVCAVVRARSCLFTFLP